MRRSTAYIIYGALILAAAGGALAFRLPRLADRPMHTDEAVQADKAGELIDTGAYKYDPVEYHGPTLYYLTLPVAWLTSADSYVETTEWTYRIVPLIFGVGLVLLLWVVLDGLRGPAVLCAAVLTAVSHAMVFYSRYYVQEMLLVFFTFGAIATGWRYARSRRVVWAILCGVFLGLMHATKETCVLAFAALGGAVVVVVLWRHFSRRAQGPPPQRPGRWWNLPAWVAAGAIVLWRRLSRPAPVPPPARPIRRWHLLALVVAGAVVSVVFFTSFFTNLRGPWDSIRTYLLYAHKAGENEAHRHPWDYYFRLLLYYKFEPIAARPAWSEALIVALAAAGVIAGVLDRGLGRANVWLVRFLSIYTIALAGIYCAIPYKTPWCMLGFLHGMILLAGVGAMAILRIPPLVSPHRGRRAAALAGRLVLGVGLIVACCHVARQTYRGCFNRIFHTSPHNPYVYGHTVNDLPRMTKRVHELAKHHPRGRKMLVVVIATNSWPIPWYLRDFDHVGYWPSPPSLEGHDPPIIIVGQDIDNEALEDKLMAKYEWSDYGLRPAVRVRLCVRQDLWDAFMETRK